MRMRSLAEITATLDHRIGIWGSCLESFVRPQTTPKIFVRLACDLRVSRSSRGDQVLASSTEVPTIGNGRTVGIAHQGAYSGEISRFESDIVAPGGTVYSDSVYEWECLQSLADAISIT